MNYNPIKFNVALIDSLTIFLPLSEIKVLDNKLIDTFQVFYQSTGEILEDFFPPRPQFYDFDGIKFRMSKIVRNSFIANEPPTEYIRLTITSKMLKENYFDGINKYNIIDIIDFINSKNVIEVTKDVFLNAGINDIDLCVNYNLLFEPYKTALDLLKVQVKPSKQHAVKLFRPKKDKENSKILSKNYGIQYSTRDTAKLSEPFVKFYNKTDELQSNSTDFYNKYIYPQTLKGLNISNIIRKEITIKDSRAKTNLVKKGIVKTSKIATLNDVLNLKQNELDLIINVSLKHYYEKKQFSPRSDLSPTDKIMCYYMHQLVEKGASKLELLSCLQIFDPANKSDAVSKSRFKKKLEDLIYITFSTDALQKKLEANTYIYDFIKLQSIF